MKKILIFLSTIFLIIGCDKSNVSNKHDDLNTKQSGVLTIQDNLFTDEFLDITQEDDYEKYLPKKYLNNYGEDTMNNNFDGTYFFNPYHNISNYEKFGIDINNNKAFAKVYEFIKNKNTLDEAYELISYLFENRDNLNYIDFNTYCLPEGYYSEQYLNEIHKCYNYYENGAEQYRITLLALLKARNIIKKHINDMTSESKKSKAYLMTAISYFNQDRLYQLDNIKKYAALWKELGGKSVDIFNEKDNEQLTALLTYAAYNDNIDVSAILQNGIDKDFIDLILAKSGLYNYLNDDYYMPIGVAKFSNYNQYYINAFFPQYHSVADTNIAMQTLVAPDKDFQPSEYDIQSSFSTDNSASEPIYILALNGVVYTVTMKDDKPLMVYFKNPAYFNTNFIIANKNDGNLPEILSENNYKYKQIFYLSYNNGQSQVIWNGNITNQQPDETKLFKLRGTLNCIQAIKDNDTKLLEYCGNREKLIKAKMLHKDKCSGKKDCFISIEDIDNTFFTGDI